VEDARGPPPEEVEPVKKVEDFGGDQEKEVSLGFFPFFLLRCRLVEEPSREAS